MAKTHYKYIPAALALAFSMNSAATGVSHGQSPEVTVPESALGELADLYNRYDAKSPEPGVAIPEAMRDYILNMIEVRRDLVEAFGFGIVDFDEEEFERAKEGVLAIPNEDLVAMLTTMWTDGGIDAAKDYTVDGFITKDELVEVLSALGAHWDKIRPDLKLIANNDAYEPDAVKLVTQLGLPVQDNKTIENLAAFEKGLLIIEDELPGNEDAEPALELPLGLE